jgi:hypothetical protein
MHRIAEKDISSLINQYIAEKGIISLINQYANYRLDELFNVSCDVIDNLCYSDNIYFVNPNTDVRPKIIIYIVANNSLFMFRNNYYKNCLSMCELQLGKNIEIILKDIINLFQAEFMEKYNLMFIDVSDCILIKKTIKMFLKDFNIKFYIIKIQGNCDIMPWRTEDINFIVHVKKNNNLVSIHDYFPIKIKQHTKIRYPNPRSLCFISTEINITNIKCDLNPQFDLLI